ncbi:hypothetical protein H0E87_025790 [Populus deltoides]|uniref:Uncharacterized protein n=1 Tax=Populus deltoides TaxID=3696 RepID=A0A8T2X1B0_POPDE|nr:hypothetical protein H0E87_025790 [Populus deltoides]
MAYVLLKKTICKQNATPKLKLLYTSRIGRETIWDLDSGLAKTDSAIETRKIIVALGKCIHLRQWGGDRIVSPVPKGNLYLERIHDFQNVWSEAIVNVLEELRIRLLLELRVAYDEKGKRINRNITSNRMGFRGDNVNDNCIESKWGCSVSLLSFVLM